MKITTSIDKFLHKPHADRPVDERIAHVRHRIDEADGILIGAGAGLSTAAGIRYDGLEFQREFSPWIERYGITDLYSSSFYPFDTQEEYWACWARHIWYCRYRPDALPLYKALYELVKDKDHFVLTTNVDGQFVKAGFEAERVFACQGDYGLLQTQSGQTKELYPNEQIVSRMMAATVDCRIPTDLIPYSAEGEPLVPHLRVDGTFVEDAQWHRLAQRYEEFVDRHHTGRLVLLELGVGFNTPGIIRFPFERMAAAYRHTSLVRFNQQTMTVVEGIRDMTVFGDCWAVERIKE
jgi:NAD-dependent SIR2 family protein deacetylase